MPDLGHIPGSGSCRRPALISLPAGVPPNKIAAGITEQACAAAASKMRRVDVPVPKLICGAAKVGISFYSLDHPNLFKKGAYLYY